MSDKLVIGRGVMREFAGEPERQIIGVVGGTHLGSLTTNPGPTMWDCRSRGNDSTCC
jgi:hypothetical protein